MRKEFLFFKDSREKRDFSSSAEGNDLRERSAALRGEG